MSENSSKEDLRTRTRLDSATPGAADFVRRLVTTIKPRLIVENRSDAGFTFPLAQGLNDNGLGKLIVYESDAERAAQLNKDIDEAGLAQSVSLDIRHESPAEKRVDGIIDLLLCSTDHEQVVRNLLPQMNPVGLILLYAAERDYDQMHRTVLRLENEHLLSVVALPNTARLVVAQKRAGRK